MPQPKKTVMISSTARDLPEHRKEVMDPSKYEPMLEVEINPRDEFYVEAGADDDAET